jgi:FkbM family methyltransferase
MISYAQNFEDVMLARAFGDRRDGFYIDVGACFPDVASVTRHFYDLGWNGVNVEPMAEPYALLAAHRTRDVNLNVAVAAYSGTITIYRGASVGDSSAVQRETAAEAVSVPCLTLADLCRKHATRHIDFLKIDVEGLELDVIRGGDWTAFRPTVVVLEVTEPWSTQRRGDAVAIGDYLGEHGYAEVHFDGLNAFYLAKESSLLASRFALPPNVLDRFVSAREGELAAINARVQEEMRVVAAAMDGVRRRAHEEAARANAMTARALRADEVVAAMTRSLSWRVTTPLRWLGRLTRRVRTQSRETGMAALRGTAGAARRSGVYAHVAPWVRERYPTFWARAKRSLLAGTTPRRSDRIARLRDGARRAPVGNAIPHDADLEHGLGAIVERGTIDLPELQYLLEREIMRQRNR